MLTDDTVPLLARVIAARTRSGASYGGWWSAQADASNDGFQQSLVIASMLLWTSGAALAENVGWLDAATRSLSDADFERLAFLVGACQHRSVRAKGGDIAHPAAVDLTKARRALLRHYIGSGADAHLERAARQISR